MNLPNPFFFLSVCLLVACSSNSEDCGEGPVEYPNQQASIDGAAYQQSAMDCRLPKVQTFQFNGFEQTEIVAVQGTRFFVDQLSFTRLNGEIIDGEITFKVLEMYNPGDIIACQLSTNGLNTRQTVEPLLSEGIFHIDITHNGEQVLITRPIRVFIPSKNESLSLLAFHSPNCPELMCSVLWEWDPRWEVIYEPIVNPAGETIRGYQTFIQSTGWKSIGRPNPSAEARGILYNMAPPGYDLSNGNVFLLYESASTAIGLFSEYDTENGVYSEKYGEIPKLTPAHVIFVGKPENEFFFGATPVITEDGKITVTRQLRSGSESSLSEYINTL